MSKPIDGRRTRHTDWIVVYDATQGDKAYACECRRCGAIQKFALPIVMSIWLVAAKEFRKLHKGCKELDTSTGSSGA